MDSIPFRKSIYIVTTALSNNINYLTHLITLVLLLQFFGSAESVLDQEHVTAVLLLVRASITHFLTSNRRDK